LPRPLRVHAAKRCRLHRRGRGARRAFVGARADAPPTACRCAGGDAMTRWLYVALAAQVLFFSAWGARLLTSHRDVGIVWLATEPVDPRDLLSGNYVALRYPIA